MFFSKNKLIQQLINQYRLVVIFLFVFVYSLLSLNNYGVKNEFFANPFTVDIYLVENNSLCRLWAPLQQIEKPSKNKNVVSLNERIRSIYYWFDFEVSNDSFLHTSILWVFAKISLRITDLFISAANAFDFNGHIRVNNPLATLPFRSDPFGHSHRTVYPFDESIRSRQLRHRFRALSAIDWWPNASSRISKAIPSIVWEEQRQRGGRSASCPFLSYCLSSENSRCISTQF